MMMTIAMEGPKSNNKGRTLIHCLASQSCDGLVHVRRREEEIEVTGSCFKNLSDMLRLKMY